MHPAAGPARAKHHARPAPHDTARDDTGRDDSDVVPSLVDSVLTGKDPNAESPKRPAAHHPRSGGHEGADDGIGDTAVSGITTADRAVASIADVVHPVTTIVHQVAAPVRPLTSSLTAPLVPVVGTIVTPLRPVTDPAGHLLTSTGLVPLPAGSARPPVPGGASHQHHPTGAGGVAPVPAGHRMPVAVHPAGVVVGAITTPTASGKATAVTGDAPADQPTPFWPVGVTLPAAGGVGSSSTMNPGAGGSAAAGHAERIAASPRPRVIGIAYTSDDLARQRDGGKPQVSPD